MSEAEHVGRRSKSILGRSRTSRRSFLKNMVAVSIAGLVGSSFFEKYGSVTSVQSAEPVELSPADADTTITQSAASTVMLPIVIKAGMTLSNALKNRKSATAFQTQPLPKEKLLDLLWAAWGINRPESGKRTAPSARNIQEIDIYVLLPDGTYLYDAQQHQLTQILDQDIRAQAGSMKDAPVHLVFVADYAKYSDGISSNREIWSAAHTGFIGQNVYLYCAAEGLGARFYAGINRETLKVSLGLREEQAVIFGQAVGYSQA